MLMSKQVNPVAGSRVGYLDVTRVDLFSNNSRFVFGVAGIGANCGIFSFCRYAAAVTEEPPNRDRLKARAVKQALSNIGLVFGIARCGHPTCARAYANSLPEHDAKEMKLCTVCTNGFKKRFSLEQ
ncbi:MAG TPA: hypothetical protein VEH04_00050 [Verrucomicrobiae bacterium]|nr:hypothetical protein [Verrucomicrobiae bacterium]